jgi:ethanolamine utilization protein EutN
MFLARVEGAVVATKKDAGMSGRTLLLLRPQLVDDKDPTRFRPGVNTIVAVDSVGAGVGELVMFCQGSSARLAPNLKDAPVDAVIIGIVDSVDVFGKQIYNAKTEETGRRARDFGMKIVEPRMKCGADTGEPMPCSCFVPFQSASRIPRLIPAAPSL